MVTRCNSSYNNLTDKCYAVASKKFPLYYILYDSNLHVIFIDLDDFMIFLSNVYVNADHFSTKRQILAIVAPDLPIATLKIHFPGVADYLIKQARIHAYQNGKCQNISVTFRGKKIEIYQP